MSLIFLSHSSVDELEAIALKQWLLDNGWDDIFLDLDPERGLKAGERWQEALGGRLTAARRSYSSSHQPGRNRFGVAQSLGLLRACINLSSVS